MPAWTERDWDHERDMRKCPDDEPDQEPDSPDDYLTESEDHTDLEDERADFEGVPVVDVYSPLDDGELSRS